MLFSFVDWPKEISEWNQPGTRTGLKVSEKEANVQWKTDLQKPWRTIAQEQLYKWKQNIKKNNCGSALLIFGNQSDILIRQHGQVPSYDYSFFSKPLCVRFFSCIVDTEKQIIPSSFTDFFHFPVCVLPMHTCTVHVWISHLVILGCLQMVVDQLKVQTIFLLQGSMELCFLRRKRKQQRKSWLSCSIILLLTKKFISECKAHSKTTPQNYYISERSDLSNLG